jgi:hypothetical protein
VQVRALGARHALQYHQAVGELLRGAILDGIAVECKFLQYWGAGILVVRDVLAKRFQKAVTEGQSRNTRSIVTVVPAQEGQLFWCDGSVV